MGKLLLLTLNEQEETAIDKIISAISNYMRLEPMQLTPVSVLSFPGLEIRQSQRRVFQDGEEVNLTRLEYNALVFLAFVCRVSAIRCYAAISAKRYYPPTGSFANRSPAAGKPI